MSDNQKEIIVGLVGNPNSGKTTVFNSLTGFHHRVGNWPGVTVERKEGEFYSNGRRVFIIDLPGTYSLGAISLDEKIAREFILEDKSDVIVDIVDASVIERHLYLTVTLLEMGAPLILVLNMMDIAQKQGITIDNEEISEVFGIPVVETVALVGKGIEELKEAIIHYEPPDKHTFKVHYGNDIEKIIREIEEVSSALSIVEKYPHRWVVLKILENDLGIVEKIKNDPAGEKVLRLAKERSDWFEKTYGLDMEMAITEGRYGFVHGLIKECVTKRVQDTEFLLNVSDKIDQVFVNRYLGLPLFLLSMWITFQLVFMVGNPLARLIEIVFELMSKGATSFLSYVSAPEFMISLVSDGIISGVGSVVVFLPNILILFFLISILEDSGYMARAAFVMDRIMHALGLHGKSFIPMILGFGCSVPAILGTRILESRKDRHLTILLIPFMSCSARLPVYVFFSAAFFAQSQGWVIFGLYMFGILVAILTAQIFRKFFIREEAAPLIMELPPYRVPKLKGIVFHTWIRGAHFLKKAGTVIFAAVMVVWLLSSLPPGVDYASSQSLIGTIGSKISFFFIPPGFGEWQSSVALLVGVAAKEAIVGTLGATYGATGQALRSIIQSHFNPLSALSFMIFTLLYVPCIPAVIAIWQEAGRKLAFISIFYSLGVAWIIATVVYQVGRFFF